MMTDKTIHFMIDNKQSKYYRQAQLPLKKKIIEQNICQCLEKQNKNSKCRTFTTFNDFDT